MKASEYNRKFPFVINQFILYALTCNFSKFDSKIHRNINKYVLNYNHRGSNKQPFQNNLKNKLPTLKNPAYINMVSSVRKGRVWGLCYVTWAWLQTPKFLYSGRSKTSWNYHVTVLSTTEEKKIQKQKQFNQPCRRVKKLKTNFLIYLQEEKSWKNA